MMFCPNSSSAKAERTMVASVTVTSATNQVIVSLPEPLVCLVMAILAVSEE